MRDIGVDIQQFRIRTGAAEFDCLFSVRYSPYHFAMTSRGINPVHLGFDVLPGYNINPHLGDKYADVLNILYVDGRSGEPFRPTNWFVQIDNQIPHQANRTEIAPEVIARLRPDLEHPERQYYSHWAYQTVNGVSIENMKKTIECMGPEAGEHSKRYNASSCWSAAPTGKNWRDDIRL